MGQYEFKVKAGARQPPAVILTIGQCTGGTVIKPAKGIRRAAKEQPSRLLKAFKSLHRHVEVCLKTE